MIAKEALSRREGKFATLATYIAGAKDKGEKLDDLWVVGCNAGTQKDDLDLVISEVEASQNLNTRAKTAKNYHLIVSFGEEKPSPDQLREIEKEFAAALGFEEHQRVVATHKNTDNFHMHVAYSKIHPQTGRMHSPWKSKETLLKLKAELEKKYDLKVDNGLESVKENANSKAQDHERHTWELSFSSYVKEHKEKLLEIREKSQSWDEFQKGISDYGVEMKKRGNGLIFKDMDGENAEKASAVDRKFSKKAMEDKFGVFPQREQKAEQTQSQTQTQSEPSKDKYERKPVDPKARKSKFWLKYLGARKRGRARNWRGYLQTQAPMHKEAAELMKAQSLFFSLLTGGRGGGGGRSSCNRQNRNDHARAKNEFFLAVARIETKEAKQAGAWWDKNEQRWFAPNFDTYRDCAKWHKPATLQEQSAAGFEAAAKKFVKEQGGELKHGMIMDGLWHRTKFEDADTGFYRAFAQGVPCVEIVKADLDENDTRNVLELKVDANLKESGREGLVWRDQALGDAELDKINTINEERIRDMRARQAYVVWNNLSVSPDHSNCSYLAEQQIAAYGVGLDAKERIVVPLRDIEGQLHSLQFVDGNGDEGLRGARTSGLLHMLGAPDPGKPSELSKEDDTVLIAQGYADAAALHELTKRPVAVVFDEENLLLVAQDMARKNPDKTIIIATTRQDQVLEREDVRAQLIKPVIRQNENGIEKMGWNDWFRSVGEHKAIQDLESQHRTIVKDSKQKQQQEYGMER
ncbi:TraI/MobA(P) family conjugative relaxase [Pseudovibrio sp. Tun.PSC04-5.I4]|uniref:TraI/MobA(P) family conjugative relaxase n=1 Tax=Pseudovibrio sp. Tun.PSC04-5.I4 TaxID=1798213 RepID=UPI000891A314|nr:TraI/MobA(P) family conjugative relaxase [Pseudovibrio sp. Tun.PSC04-5.I4]SDR48986.1 Relaxase/Mobilisation nuclease domain-containing protein [Pseudovibrio sp. Tun.PSC04-5.I4]